MKLLFLDIDGVLNSEKSRLDNTQVDEHFCPIACSNFKRIIAAVPDFKIVISSSIRKIYHLQELKSLLRKNAGIPEDMILGITPSLRGCRGDEIKSWIGNDSVDFVIVDDDADMGDFMSNLVRTSYKEGLSVSDSDEIIKRLLK